MISHLLFDLDGTLTDSKPGITRGVQHALHQLGIKVDHLDELVPFIGPPLVESFMKYYPLSYTDALLAVQHYRDYYREKGIYESELYKNIESTLSALTQSGFILGVATAKPTPFAQIVLKRFGLDPYFEHIVGATMDESRIHKDQIIEHALLQFGGISPDHFIMIGDREQDMSGAKKHGLKAIGVLYGYGSEAELLEGGADHLIHEHEELLNHL